MQEVSPQEEARIHGTRMSLGEHLEELRKRLFRGVLAVALAFAVSLFFQDQITEIILRPHQIATRLLNADSLARAQALVAADESQRSKYFEADGTFIQQVDTRLSALDPTESMWFVLKICGYFALFVGSPVLLWQLWQFVGAGLYERERRWVRLFFLPALLLFLGGILFCYFLVVPYGLFYLLKSVRIDLVKPDLRVETYFSFLSTLCLAMGLIFQLPMLMTFCGTVQMVEARTFRRLFWHFVVAAFVVSAFLTPGPDVYSQTAMALPMIALYGVGILGAAIGGRRHARKAQV
jgi:sec-independent protein translocase protein TatC